MKVSELSGSALEYWFAKATGKCDVGGDYEGATLADWIGMDMQVFWWSDIGPVMELKRICLSYMPSKDTPYVARWYASPHYSVDWVGGCSRVGATAQIAIMRCLVAMTYGEEVSDEGRA